MCDACKKAGDGKCRGLCDLDATAPLYPHSYLLECPRCKGLWMGHGFTPHYMAELTPAEADEVFPDWRGRERIPVNDPDQSV